MKDLRIDISPADEELSAGIASALQDEPGIEMSVAEVAEFGLSGPEAVTWITLAMVSGLLGNRADAAIQAALSRVVATVRMVAAKREAKVTVVVNGLRYDVRDEDGAMEVLNAILDELGS